ncbi:small lysine-rich protein 1 [Xiphophorus hellerii]|uniref:small lysine-rich protein 1 n=1 Tax=Xiphophorus hellerii TaxID=8084 RepID=UPI0013B3E41F|nr:small lysine-rich protein 1 [Xiphophorus hellerii]
MEVDILSSAAMENLYYISHNAPDCLEYRGFGWPNSQRRREQNRRTDKICQTLKGLQRHLLREHF